METSDRPVVEQKFVILNDTLRLNQGLSDERFKAIWKADDKSDTLKGVRSEFGKAQVQLRKVGSRRRLNETLSNADEQKILLEASAPSRGTFNNTTVAVALSSLIGATFIASYILLKRAG